MSGCIIKYKLISCVLSAGLVATFIMMPVFNRVVKAQAIQRNPKAGYPGYIRDSNERRAIAEREWRRLLDTYGVAQTPPDLYPITYTPRSLLGVSGGIEIVRHVPEESTVLGIREVARSFIDRWRDLIGADSSSVSLESAEKIDNIWKLTYRQANYAFPVSGGFGDLTLDISQDGKIVRLEDRFIPVVDLPPRPTFERSAAEVRIVGRIFTTMDSTGQDRRIRIESRDEVITKQVLVLPIERGDSLEVHLALEIVAGKNESWTLYIDAITGEELRVIRNK